MLGTPTFPYKPTGSPAQASWIFVIPCLITNFGSRLIKNQVGNTYTYTPHTLDFFVSFGTTKSSITLPLLLGIPPLPSFLLSWELLSREPSRPRGPYR